VPQKHRRVQPLRRNDAAMMPEAGLSAANKCP